MNLPFFHSKSKQEMIIKTKQKGMTLNCEPVTWTESIGDYDLVICYQRKLLVSDGYEPLIFRLKRDF